MVGLLLMIVPVSVAAVCQCSVLRRSCLSPVVASGIVDSSAYFDAFILRVGLPASAGDRLRANGFKTLSALAYAVSQGQDQNTIFEKFCTDILTDTATAGDRALLRRALHEAYALSIAHLRTQVDTSEEKQAPRLPPAEREARRDRQRERLKGVDTTGFHEPSYKVLDKMNEYVESDELKYESWNFYNSRESEIRGVKSADTIRVEQGLLKLTKGKEGADVQADVHDTYLARGALKRRSLAMDMQGLASFATLEAANEYLFSRLHMPCPPNCSPPSLHSLAEADRELWRLVIDQCRTSLKVASDGRLPIDKALEAFLYDPRVAFHLFPVPSGKRARGDHDAPGDAPPKRRAQQSPATSAKGQRKGSGKSRSTPTYAAWVDWAQVPRFTGSPSLLLL